MAVIMSVFNYFLLLPAYTFFLNMPAMSAPDMRQYIVAGFYRLISLKGYAISLVFMILLYENEDMDQ